MIDFNCYIYRYYVFVSIRSIFCVYFPLFCVNCYSLYLLNSYMCDCLLVTVILMYSVDLIHYVKNFVAVTVLKLMNCYMTLPTLPLQMEIITQIFSW